MEKSIFFNSAPGDPRMYQASDFAGYFGTVLSSGLFHIDEVPTLEVHCDGGDLRTYVSSGKAAIQGYFYENTSDLYLEHSIPEATLDRIDRIVLRLDKRNQSRFIRLFIIEGVSSETPVAPDLQRDEYIFELCLAQILVRANTSTLSEDDLVDTRLIESLCGLVYSLISIPLTQFQEQWDDFMEGIIDNGFVTSDYFEETLEGYATKTDLTNASVVLATEIDKKAVITRNIIAGNGMSGGGTLAADRTLTLGTPSTLTPSTTNASTSTSHTHEVATATQAEAQTGTISTKFVTPLRVKEYVDTRLENGLGFRVVSGEVQALIGGVWTSMGGGVQVGKPRTASVSSGSVGASTTIVNISGVKGRLEAAYVTNGSSGGNTITLKVTIDGVLETVSIAAVSSMTVLDYLSELFGGGSDPQRKSVVEPIYFNNSLKVEVSTTAGYNATGHAHYRLKMGTV